VLSLVFGIDFIHNSQKATATNLQPTGLRHIL
jgi:hypothetical protein